uniref:Uncharacterized protein n=1 Tax=Megaselia scalaris TaxID=36166 RepID=T1GBL3_MEGSC
SFASAVAQPKPTEVKDDKNRPNYSFISNIFRGQIESKEMFPFPDVLTAEQKELTESLVDPFEKFFLEVNDAAKNDETSIIDEKTIEHMKEKRDTHKHMTYVPKEFIPYIYSNKNGKSLILFEIKLISVYIRNLNNIGRFQCSPFHLIF